MRESTYIHDVMAVLKFKLGGGILTPDTVFFTLTRIEWRCAALWSDIALAPNSLPGMVGYQSSGDIKVLAGAVHHTADMMSYLAKMRMAYDDGHVHAYELTEWGP